MNSVSKDAPVDKSVKSVFHKGIYLCTLRFGARVRIIQEVSLLPFVNCDR